MLKKAIRERYLQKRIKLADDEWERSAAMIAGHFDTFQFPTIKCLLSFYPLPEKKEFDISRSISSLKKNNPRIKIGWPRIEPDTFLMEAYQVEEDGLYAKNKYNILEPLNGELIAPELFDMIFLPMIAFDQRGYRIGYGKGFYDRYLARCRPDTLKVGFSFFDPVVRIKDINEFDVPLDICITPLRIYEF